MLRGVVALQAGSAEQQQVRVTVLSPGDIDNPGSGIRDHQLRW